MLSKTLPHCIAISYEKMIAKVDTCVSEMVEKHEGEINLLCTIPGIDRNSAITIISEIGTDIRQFGSSKRLCCWAGLTPGNNKSAGKKKSVRISRAGGGAACRRDLPQLAPAGVPANHNALAAPEIIHLADKRTGGAYHRLALRGQIFRQIAEQRRRIPADGVHILDQLLQEVPLLQQLVQCRNLIAVMS